MSLRNPNLFGRSLTLAATALIIHVGTANAAGSTGDTQQRIKDVLTGVTTAPSALQSGPRDTKAASVTADIQDSVNQLLLGTSVSRRGGNEAIQRPEVARASDATDPHQRKSAHPDTQTAVQEVLLGQHDASNASLLASRSTR